MIRAILLAALVVCPAYAQTELEVAAVPGVNEAGRQAYANFLLTDIPRAFAIGSNGAFGSYGSDGYRVGPGDIEMARAGALQSCAAQGATDCALYAENLDVVWRGRAPVPDIVPGAFTSTLNYQIVPDSRFFWHGPTLAAGVFVWGHGTGGGDLRGKQPPPYARALNDSGSISCASTAIPTPKPKTATALRDGLSTPSRTCASAAIGALSWAASYAAAGTVCRC